MEIKFDFDLEYNPNSIEDISHLSHLFAQFYGMRTTATGVMKSFVEKVIAPLETAVREGLGEEAFHQQVLMMDYMMKINQDKIGDITQTLNDLALDAKPPGEAPKS
ncbi:MAG: hypothetical protein GY810_20930 [Aureispira sp.]|nr:hypothetical protein [Aureispira sp.]